MSTVFFSGTLVKSETTSNETNAYSSELSEHLFLRTPLDGCFLHNFGVSAAMYFLLLVQVVQWTFARLG